MSLRPGDRQKAQPELDQAQRTSGHLIGLGHRAALPHTLDEPEDGCAIPVDGLRVLDCCRRPDKLNAEIVFENSPFEHKFLSIQLTAEASHSTMTNRIFEFLPIG
jgi:hypothetical protein